MAELRTLDLGGRTVDGLWDGTVEQTYARRARHLWEYARRLGLDASFSEDVAHEAFVRLLALSPANCPRNADAWLFRTVHNLVIDQHRRLGRLHGISLVEQAVAPDERLAVWEQVDQLPERQRAAIYLRYRADFEYSAIADVLGISEFGARADVFRALTRLREWMVDR